MHDERGKGTNARHPEPGQTEQKSSPRAQPGAGVTRCQAHEVLETHGKRRRAPGPRAPRRRRPAPPSLTAGCVASPPPPARERALLFGEPGAASGASETRPLASRTRGGRSPRRAPGASPACPGCAGSGPRSGTRENQPTNALRIGTSQCCAPFLSLKPGGGWHLQTPARTSSQTDGDGLFLWAAL